MKILLLLSLIFTISCTSSGVGNLESVAKKKASFDFNCPEQYVTVLAEGLTTFAAKGCGKTATYEVKCSLGPCVAIAIE